MQDRLKSRFFHKPSGKYLNQNDLVYCNGKYHLISYSRDSNGILFPYILTSFNESEIIEEQCTGLKDKNSKLVYEGDIVKNHRDEIAVIVWLADNASFFLNGRTDWECDWLIGISNYEIIGNIHENADLLENKDEFI